MSAAPSRIEVPFTTRSGCLLVPPRVPGDGRPPLLVALHGQGQSGRRHQRWLDGAVPDGFAAAFPDGFHAHEVRKPDAPIRLGYGWYLFTGDQEAFAESLALAEEALWRVVDAALGALGADPTRVYLQGFSQGCYLTHCAAVRNSARVAGWIGCAGRLKDELLGRDLPSVAGKPVLIQHGEDDRAIGPERAAHGAALLASHGADVTLRRYADTGHVISEAMRTDMRAWLAAREPDHA